MKSITGRWHLESWLTFLLVYMLSLANGTFAQDEEPLPKKSVRRVVEKVVPAMKLHDQTAFLNASMPLFKTLKPEQVEAVDALCIEHGTDPATEWFTELVLSSHYQGIDLSPVISSLSMSMVTLDGVVDRIAEFEESTADHFIMQEPLEVPSDFLKSEQVFWSLHVLHKEFENASRDLEFARALVKKHKKKLQRKFKDKNYPEQLVAIQERVQQQYDAIKERVADLRLKRFESAHETLIDPSNQNDFELLLTSSMALEQDGHALVAFLDGNDSITRESLAVAGLLEQVNEKMDSGMEAAGDIAVKARLFRIGLQYWERGRFGAGTLANGLVKGANATKSTEMMELLLMPKTRDKPISSFLPEEETIVGHDRRHYKTWAAEYRSVTVVEGGTENYSRSKVTARSNPTVTKTKQFW